MSTGTCFEIAEEQRAAFIDNNIIANLHEDDKEAARERTKRIVNNYEGRDVDALSVLAYAAEQGRFDEFAGKLEEHYRDSLEYVHPNARKVARIPGAVRAEVFFTDCYIELDIEPRK